MQNSPYKKKSVVIKLAIFLLMDLSLWFTVGKCLKKPMNGNWENASVSMVYNKNQQFDVILLGTSMVLANINNQELYSQYGMTSISLGEPEQPIYLSYYLLKEALKHQTPKVVVFDVQSLFYTNEKIENDLLKNEYFYLHYTLDKMKDAEIKYEALKEARELKSDIDFWDYDARI